jgi:predicted alpha-1,2-mannosidase
MPMRRGIGGILTAGLACVVLVAGETVAGPLVAADGATRVVALVGNPSSLVNPMAGTGAGAVNPGAIGEFPGADLPFGMIQWSPNTTPNVAMSGSGYSYADSAISGFSLTNLSGVGCAAYGDVPILPTVGPIGGTPETTTATFSHSSEHAAPGRYQVTLGSPAVTTQLAVTARTGLSKMTFPATDEANLLFKVAGSANPVTASSFHLVGQDAITGQVTSGQFCGTGTNYTLYFSAQFSRPFASAGSWQGAAVTPGATACQGPTCGAFVTFNTETQRSVLMKVGISFVSTADATANLRAEDPGWSVTRVEAAGTSRWNRLLGRISVGGGTRNTEVTFYTALYHSLLSPTVVSDDNGEYTGDDGRTHRSARGAQYANFSEWDIYRSQIELVSLLARHQAGDMMQSLVNDAEQGGWLPKFAIADGDALQMNGDSADPIIAAAYAFGVRDFDVAAALKAMVKGATENETGHGLQIERQYLSQYLTQHFVPAGSLDLYSIDYSIGGSVTLEYALDDFSIAQLAAALGDHAVYTNMMQRAHNWQYLFNPATGYLQARNADGSFTPGPAFQTSLLEPGGELGFEEGNAIQYSWSVPQDLSALGTLMGGNSQAVAKLNTFFTQLNATRDAPYDWAGNEPNLWTPWEYDYFGAPSRTQQVVRRIVNTLYANAPVNEPGNDDLGAISSWYVWAAIGLYPVTPATANLALGSPLFPAIVLTLPDGQRIVMHAPAASPAMPYVHTLAVSGVPTPKATPSCASPAASTSKDPTAWNQPWLPSSIITTGGTLAYGLSSVPDPSWGSATAASPPSFGTGRLPAVGFSLPSGGVTVPEGQTTTVQLGLQPAETGPSTVRWSARGTGLLASPSDGAFTVTATNETTARDGLSSCAVTAPASQVLTIVAPTVPGTYVLDVTLKTTAGQSLPPVVLDVTVTA